MGAKLVTDGRLAAAAVDVFHHPVDVRAAHAAGELAIAERPRPPFAEEVVVLGVKLPTPVERANRRDPRLHRLTAFQHQRPVAAHRQVVCRQQSAGTGSDNHGLWGIEAVPGAGS